MSKTQEQFSRKARDGLYAENAGAIFGEGQAAALSRTCVGWGEP